VCVCVCAWCVCVRVCDEKGGRRGGGGGVDWTKPRYEYTRIKPDVGWQSRVVAG
jgi:hypothetical protein